MYPMGNERTREKGGWRMIDVIETTLSKEFSNERMIDDNIFYMRKRV